MTKRVILAIIDGLSNLVFQKGYFPGLIGLVQRRSSTVEALNTETIPTMTEPCVSTILTGTKDHGIVGNVTYDRLKQRVVDIGSNYLKAPTILEILERAGFKTCVITDKGTERICSKCDTPIWVKTVASILSKGSSCLKILKQEILAGNLPMLEEAPVEKLTTDLATQLIFTESPEMLIIHFNEYDRLAHKHGPLSTQSIGVLKNIDRQICRFISYLDLNTTLFCLMGDHGNVPVRRYFDIYKTLKNKFPTIIEEILLEGRRSAKIFLSDTSNKNKIIKELCRVNLVGKVFEPLDEMAGDIWAFSNIGSTFVFPEERSRRKGAHGADTMGEMIIPFLALLPPYMKASRAERITQVASLMSKALDLKNWKEKSLD